MKRLVYSPKAFVYIQTEDGKVWNISDLVVSGNVHRKINQVSTAEVTFKNPFKRFTQPGNPTFRPMDKITIFLQRIPGRPVQTFTGYLDSAPYFQMYPGTCTIRASCTLKRLMFTYFDPGVPFMTAFLSKYGWQLTPDGMLGKMIQSEGKNSAGMSTLDQAQGASVAQLLFAVLRWIGGWTGNREVFIDELPLGLIQRISRIYDVLAEEEKEAMADFEAFLKAYIGVSSQGGDDSEVTRANISLDNLDDEQNLVLDTLMSVGDAMNVGKKLCCAAIATGLVEDNLHNSDKERDADSQNWRQERRGGYGDKWATSGKGPGGEGSLNIEASARRYYTECKQFDHGQTAGELAADVQRPRADLRGKYTERMADAEKLYDQYLSKKGEDENDSSDSSRSPSNRSEPASDNSDTEEKSGGSKDRKSKETDDGGALGWARNKLGKYAEPGGTNRGPELDDLENTFHMSGAPWCCMFATTAATHGGLSDEGKSASVAQVYGWAKEGSHGYQKGLKDDPKPGDLMIFGQGDHIGMVESVDGDKITTIEGNTSANKVARVQRTKGEGEFARPDYSSGGAGTSDGTGDGGDSGGAATDALQAARAATLFTQFNVGAFDQAESYLLQGDKSLMNDQPLMPFIEELCKGSMRNFMSMPDGSFYAFHPDYFGSYSGKPYWQINDIEVMEGSIELSDDALATHVFVTGDWYGGGSNDISLKIQSHGVVNILNAGVADFLNVDPEYAKNEHNDSKQKGKKGKKEDELQPFLGSPEAAIEFLRRYGARPHVESPPFIRSHVFETFYAFQMFMLMWARQFLTTFTFTFMPELYPGGIVAFPEHGIQMYIDEVHHTFDYTSGFTTQANLSAPAAMPWVAGQKGTAAISRGMVRGGVLATDQ